MSRLSYILVSALAAVVLIASADAKSPISFRLDDIQCSWQQENAMLIIDAFARHSVPLTIAIITEGAPDAIDCYVDDVKARMATMGNALELSSHTVNHIAMNTLSAADQWFQANASKQHIDFLFGTNVTLFVPPKNSWDTTITIPTLVRAGYTTMTPACDSFQVDYTSPDTQCTVNMIPSIAQPFFQNINGIVHAPIGVSISDFNNGVLMTPAMLMADTTGCILSADQSSETCSIASQINSMGPFVKPGTQSFSVIMMHPQDFGGDGVTGNATWVNSFFDTLLPLAKAQYDIYTISDMVKVASGGPVPTYYGGSGTTGSSSPPTSTGSSTPPPPPADGSSTAVSDPTAPAAPSSTGATTPVVSSTGAGVATPSSTAAAAKSPSSSTASSPPAVSSSTAAPVGVVSSSTAGGDGDSSVVISSTGTTPIKRLSSSTGVSSSSSSTAASHTSSASSSVSSAAAAIASVAIAVVVAAL
jgi:peptidoglycan/xylan/chitin deacetylase (PgdA/CDA1 family)